MKPRAFKSVYLLPSSLPGATMATILKLGALHARLYENKKIEEKRERELNLCSIQSIPLRKFRSGCVGMLIKPGLELFIQVSPVDGIVLRFGELKGIRWMIEQVKGHST